MCLNVCVKACIGVCLYVCVKACLGACLHVCVKACLGVCLHLCVFRRGEMRGTNEYRFFQKRVS